MPDYRIILPCAVVFIIVLKHNVGEGAKELIS
jgi:hypothetical protein